MSTREGQAGERHEGASEARRWNLIGANSSIGAVGFAYGPELPSDRGVEVVALADVVAALRSKTDGEPMGYYRRAAWNSAADFITERFGKQGEGG